MLKKYKPPILKDILADGFDKTRLANPTDHKGRYLPYAEFVHRYKQPVQEWAAVKLARLAIARPLPLADEQGRPFTYALPESFQIHLHNIDRLAAPLLAERQPDSALFLVQSLHEEAISSAQLEGASTTRKAAKEMLDNARAPRDENERMVFNNYALMQFAKTAVNEPLSLDLIKQFHRLAVNETENPYVTAGAFRTDNSIFVQDAEGNIAHRPPPFEQIEARLEALCRFANTDHSQAEDFIHPAVKAAVIHYTIGYEHPFSDGNGRTARALFYWFMLKQGYSAFEYISISRLLKQAPKQYGLSYLYSETDDNDLTYFIDYQLRTISRAIEAFRAYLERKQQEHQTLLQWLLQSGKGRRLNKRQADILSKAIKQSGRVFTLNEIRNDYQISLNTAKADLNGLTAAGALAALPDTRPQAYIALPGIAERFGK